jgi:hypothetical protein
MFNLNSSLKINTTNSIANLNFADNEILLLEQLELESSTRNILPGIQVST